MKPALYHIFRITLLAKLAAAYLEPGSTSFLLKILISGLVGIAVFFRQIWSYLRILGKKIRALKQETPITAVSDTLPTKEPQ